MRSSKAIKTTEEANYHHLVMDVVWFGLAFAATSRFLSVYAIRLGAGPTEIGWLTSMPAIVFLMSSSLAGWWRKRHCNSVAALFWPALCHRVVFILPAFAPLLPREWQPFWLVLALVLPALPQGVAGVNFVVMMREAVDKGRMTALVSRRMMAMNVAVCIAALAFGFWLEKAPFPGNYQAMFGLAFLFALVSQWHLTKIRVPDSASVQTAFQQRFRPWHSPGFQQVALLAMLTHITFFSIAPILPLRLVNELGAEEGFMALFGIAELVAGAGITLFTNRLVARFGNRTVMATAMFGTAGAAMLIAVSPNLHLTLVAAALSGASWTAAAIGLFGYFNENTPVENMTSYATAYHQVLGLAMFAGPMLGSSLAESGVDLMHVLMLGAILRAMAGLLTEYEFHRPEHVHLHRPHLHWPHLHLPHVR